MAALRRQPNLNDGTGAQVPYEPLLLLEASLHPEVRAQSPVVFMSGSVYREEITRPGEPSEFRGLDPWREEVAAIVDEAGFIPVHGVNMTLYDSDAMAGAGFSMFHLAIAPYLLVNGTRRVGHATAEEALSILGAGGNIGFIVPTKEYADVLNFIKHPIGTEYPPVLPAWWAALDLQPEDIIAGVEGVGAWLRTQSQSRESIRAFRGRHTSDRHMAHILYYLRKAVGSDERERELVNRILKKLNIL